MPRPPRARHVEGRREALAGRALAFSMPARSKPVRPSASEVDRGSGHLDRHVHGMGPQRHGDEPDMDAGRAGALAGAPDDGGDAVPQVETPRQVQRGGPADLGIAGALGGDVLDELARAALQRRGVLEQRDGQVEGPQEVGLVEAARRRHEPGAHGLRGRWARPGRQPARRRASSSAVSGRSEPSRWRCSSALGMASNHALWPEPGALMRPC